MVKAGLYFGYLEGEQIWKSKQPPVIPRINPALEAEFQLKDALFTRKSSDLVTQKITKEKFPPLTPMLKPNEKRDLLDEFSDTTKQFLKKHPEPEAEMDFFGSDPRAWCKQRFPIWEMLLEGRKIKIQVQNYVSFKVFVNLYIKTKLLGLPVPEEEILLAMSALNNNIKTIRKQFTKLINKSKLP